MMFVGLLLISALLAVQGARPAGWGECNPGCKMNGACYHNYRKDPENPNKCIHLCSLPSKGGCEQICNPRNWPGFCECNKGWIQSPHDSKKCILDTDPCAKVGKMKGGCAHECVNVPQPGGGAVYKCVCPEGFMISYYSGCKAASAFTMCDKAGCKGTAKPYCVQDRSNSPKWWSPWINKENTGTAVKCVKNKPFLWNINGIGDEQAEFMEEQHDDEMNDEAEAIADIAEAIADTARPANWGKCNPGCKMNGACYHNYRKDPKNPNKCIHLCSLPSKGGCEQICNPRNWPGFCECNKGWIQSPHDSKKCILDTDPCAKVGKMKGGCAHKCVNVPQPGGGAVYKCVCPEGFMISYYSGCKAASRFTMCDKAGCKGTAKPYCVQDRSNSPKWWSPWINKENTGTAVKCVKSKDEQAEFKDEQHDDEMNDEAEAIADIAEIMTEQL